MKDLITKYLPKTYYADRSSEERIKLFVEHWRRLVRINQELEIVIQKDNSQLDAKSDILSDDTVRQKLFNYFYEMHRITLLDGDIEEIKDIILAL